jgi:hypothetical protein
MIRPLVETRNTSNIINSFINTWERVSEEGLEIYGCIGEDGLQIDISTV